MIAKVEEDESEYKTGTHKLSQKPLTQKRKGNAPAKGLVIDLSKQERVDLSQLEPEAMTPDDRKKLASKLRRRMKQAANDMDFELAAMIRDTVHGLESVS
jgi:excinuclease UvrABC helicase subunit UvrB